MLSEYFKRCRERRKMTQKELAQKLGVSVAYVSRVENGKVISLKQAERIATALGVNYENIIKKIKKALTT